MSEKDVLIETGDFAEITAYIKKQGENNQKMLDEYYQAMKQMKEAALVSGDVADAMEKYLDNVQKMQQIIQSESAAAASAIEAFEKDVQKTDK